MNDSLTDAWQKALRPIASLISKSEKAQQKLVPGTWQHTMLRNNLKALHLASTLMHAQPDAVHEFTRDDLQEAIRALDAMMSRTEKALAKFARGSSQHTLQRNRLDALQTAKVVAEAALGRCGG